MWVTLGKLKNVENVPGVGWRLKWARLDRNRRGSNLPAGFGPN